MQHLSDIIIVCLLAYGFIFGLSQGFFRKLWRTVVFCSLLLIIYFAFKEVAIDFIRYDLLRLIKPDGIVINVNEDYSIIATNIEDIFVVLQNADENLSGQYLKLTCALTCKFIFVVACIGVSLIASIVISWPSWHLVKFIIPSKFRKHVGIFQRLFGCVVGTFEWIVITYLYAISLGQVCPILTEILPLLENVNQLSNYYSQISEVVKYINLILDPSNSIIMTNLFKILSSIGIDSYKLLSFEWNNARILFKDSYDSLISAIDKILKNINSSNSGSENENVEGISNIISSYKFGFNYLGI